MLNTLPVKIITSYKFIFIMNNNEFPPVFIVFSNPLGETDSHDKMQNPVSQVGQVALGHANHSSEGASISTHTVHSEASPVNSEDPPELVKKGEVSNPIPAAPISAKETLQSILIKLVNVVPFRFVNPQAPQKVKEEKNPVEPAVPNKGSAIVKGEHVESTQKIVPEEIEQNARTQTAMKGDPQIFKPHDILKLNVLHTSPREFLPNAPLSGSEKNEIPSKAQGPVQKPVERELGFKQVAPQSVNPSPHSNSTQPAINFLSIPEQQFQIKEPSNPSIGILNVTPAEKLQPVSKDPIPLARVEGEIHRTQSINGRAVLSPRLDAIVNLNRNEHGIQQIIPKPDDHDIMRIPVQPDQPPSKETLFKREGSRSQREKLHADEGQRLGDLILMMVCAVLCGSRSPGDIYHYLEARNDFFKIWLGLKSGLPSYRMLTLALGRFKPHQMGKLIQLAFGKEKNPLEFLRIWESSRGLILGQLSSDNKLFSVEETLHLFDLQGSCVNIDHPTIQPEWSQQIARNEGDFLYSLKGQHGPLYEKALEFFESTLKEKGLPCDHFRDVNQTAQYAELREIVMSNWIEWIEHRNLWQGLKSVIKYNSELIIGSKTVYEKRMYLSSLPMNAERASYLLHFMTFIEGRVNWSLDVDFSSWKVEHLKQNLEHLRLFCWQLLTNDTQSPPEAHRKKASQDPAYLRTLLGF